MVPSIWRQRKNPNALSLRNAPYFCTFVIMLSSWVLWGAFPGLVCVLVEECMGPLCFLLPSKTALQHSVCFGVPLADSEKESSWSLSKRKNLVFVHEEDCLSRLKSHGAKINFFPAKPQVTVTWWALNVKSFFTTGRERGFLPSTLLIFI